MIRSAGMGYVFFDDMYMLMGLISSDGVCSVRRDLLATLGRVDYEDVGDG